ncbi:MAG: hypothetical protein OXR07_03160 [Nitrospira sp.]|nr:hypothetical protein [Nitrospira sp.]
MNQSFRSKGGFGSVNVHGETGNVVKSSLSDKELASIKRFVEYLISQTATRDFARPTETAPGEKGTLRDVIRKFDASLMYRDKTGDDGVSKTTFYRYSCGDYVYESRLVLYIALCIEELEARWANSFYASQSAELASMSLSGEFENV